MVDTVAGEAPDRLIIKLEAGGPIEVGDLTGSFAALARMYERHYRQGGEPAPKLYITKLESGSIIAEVTPYIVLLGVLVMAMDHSIIVSEFARRLTRVIKAFSDPSETADHTPPPSRDDALDIREFVRPLAGRKGASLGIKHARFIQEHGERRTVAEYVFDEAEINRATINITETLSEPEPPIPLESPSPSPGETGDTLREVALGF